MLILFLSASQHQLVPYGYPNGGYSMPIPIQRQPGYESPYGSSPPLSISPPYGTSPQQEAELLQKANMFAQLKAVETHTALEQEQIRFTEVQRKIAEAQLE